MDFNTLFEEETREKTKADRFVTDVENDFVGKRTITEEQKSRNEEREKLETELKEWKTKLRRAKNTKNCKRTAVNDKMHACREKYRLEISRIENRLLEIKDEETGGKIDAHALVNASEKAEKNKQMTWKDVMSGTPSISDMI